ncbi:archease [Candidatus Latescibacterota bacterium]
MPYRYLEDIAAADAAFEAWGHTQEELFTAAADAAMNVMVENIDSITGQEHRTVHLESDKLDMLLFKLLEELLYYKDAETLLMRVSGLTIKQKDTRFSLDTVLSGEKIDPKKHELNVDIKAVTLHRFRVKETPRGWKATVVLDI